MLPSPLHVEVRAGALERVRHLVADGRISSDGRFVLLVGSGMGAEVIKRIGSDLPEDRVIVVADDRLDTAMAVADRIRAARVDVVVAVGGGRTIDIAKYASSRLGLPLAVVATSLAHDGIASPVSVLSVGDGRASFGVATPVAVSVDLDFVQRSDIAMLRAGVGDVVSNLSALADWRLAADLHGETIDGLAASFAGTAARAVLSRRESTRALEFLSCLADSLILSGMAMAVAGTSRPCSGACHEISHAIDELFPGTATHGEQVALGALFASVLRDDLDLAADLASCLSHHGLPTSPADIGLSDEAFLHAVLHAPTTRPDRYTILEHLDLQVPELARHLGTMEDLVARSRCNDSDVVVAF